MNIENKNKIIEGLKATVKIQQEKIKHYEKALKEITFHRKDSLSSYCDNYVELVIIAEGALEH